MSNMPSPVLDCAFAPGPLTNAIIEGRIGLAGHQTRHHALPLHEIFDRAFADAPFDLCELSFGRYVAAIGGDRTKLQYVALPVFPLRRFRHGIIYVRDDAGLSGPEDLAGRRIGCASWAQTALVTARGHLLDENGISATSIDWVLGGVNRPTAPVAPRLHRAAIRIAVETDRSLAMLLAMREIDAIMALEAPVPPAGSTLRFRTLVSDPTAAASAALARSGFVPIMHVIAARRTRLDAEPGLASAAVQSFERARALAAAAGDADATLSPVGLDENRSAIAAMVRHAHDQGLLAAPVPAEELFV